MIVHQWGFGHDDGTVSGIGVSLYPDREGSAGIEAVANHVIDGIRAEGHTLKVSTTRTMGGAWALVAVDAIATIGDTDMWHRFTEPDAQWYPTEETT